MRKSIAATVLVLMSAVAGAATPSSSAGFADAPNADETLSQAIRSNAVHYWNYVANLPASNALKAYSQYQGLVVGDPHLGNFSVVPVADASGHRQMKFLDIDFDDAGVGPFAFDLARLILTVKATEKDIKTKDIVKELLEAYQKGLSGQSVTPPKKVGSALTLGLDAYDKMDADYVDKKTSHGKFKLKDGELEAYKEKYSLAQIESLFPRGSVLDVATRPRERGGSVDAVRIWVLVKGVGKGVSNSIQEIKGYEPSGLSKFQRQQDPMALANAVESTFWAGLDKSAYSLVQLAGDVVWLRQKKVALFDVPYGIKKHDDKTFVEELSIFDANYLGLLHGAQPGAAAYAQAIARDHDKFADALADVSKDYLDIAKAALH